MKINPNSRLVLRYLPTIAKGFYEYHILSHFRPLLPRELMLVITYRCNAKCVMCNIWKKSKKTEISYYQLRQIISSKLFSEIETINLTGGEPTLRKDLPQIARLLTRKLPRLKRITLSTNGLNTEQVVSSCIEMAKSCDKSAIDLLVDVSLDGIGKVHDNIRNIPGAFEKVKNTLFKLQEIHQNYHFRLGIICTVSRENIHHISDFLNWCRQFSFKRNFFIISFNDNYFFNKESEERLKFVGKDEEALDSFLKRLGKEMSLFDFSAYYFEDLRKMIINGQSRTTPCLFSSEACILDAYGDLYYCPEGKKLGNYSIEDPYDIYLAPKNLDQRKMIIKEKCPTCTMACFLETGIAKELTKYIKFLMTKYYKNLLPLHVL